MISRDDLPETPEWTCEPRCCPFESCGVCETAQQAIWRHDEPHIIRSDN
jgi:hypothetical protein